MAKWREAPEVREIAERLIPDYHRRIQLWADEIRYVFRDEAQKSKGRLVYGKSSIISGLSAYCVNNVAGADNDYGQAGPTDLFVIEIAEDVWERLDERQRTALVDHELCHLDVEFDESTGELSRKIRAHDVEEFTEIAQRYGTWEPRLAEFKLALSQLSLFQPQGGAE